MKEEYKRIIQYSKRFEQTLMDKEFKEVMFINAVKSKSSHLLYERILSFFYSISSKHFEEHKEIKDLDAPLSNMGANPGERDIARAMKITALANELRYFVRVVSARYENSPFHTSQLVILNENNPELTLEHIASAKKLAIYIRGDAFMPTFERHVIHHHFANLDDMVIYHVL